MKIRTEDLPNKNILPSSRLEINLYLTMDTNIPLIINSISCMPAFIFAIAFKFFFGFHNFCIINLEMEV